MLKERNFRFITTLAIQFCLLQNIPKQCKQYSRAGVDNPGTRIFSAEVSLSCKNAFFIILNTFERDAPRLGRSMCTADIADYLPDIRSGDLRFRNLSCTVTLSRRNSL